MKEKDIILEPRNNYNYSPDKSITYDSIIMGGGIAGFSAAMYAARLGMKALVIGEMLGGTVALTGAIENYPGFVSIRGFKLAELIENHARDYDIDIFNGIADRIERKGRLFRVKAEKMIFKGKTVILATGSDVKKLGVPGEKEFLGNGVGYCAICDATQFKGRKVAIIGGGDSAVKEANLLTEYASKVYIINNEDRLHPEQHNMKNLREKIRKGKVIVMNSIEITAIKGSGNVEKVIFNKPVNRKKELDVDGVFIYIGRIPVSTLAKDIGVRLNRKGEVRINRNSETNIPGFYAAGDVTDISWKQAIMGAAQGVSAAYHAYEYLNKG